MRLLFVVQRYGASVAGGAEQFCAQMATRMVDRGHSVDVLTTTARSYVDWANELERGSTVIEGVHVHRLPVARPRDNELFSALNARVLAGHRPMPLHLQHAWMSMQGPFVPDIAPWLTQHASAYDVAAFYTYLYYTTWAGLPAAASLVPTLLHPTAHDEPPIHLPLFDLMFRLPHGFGFLTPEEATFVRRRFRSHRTSAITGIGIDLDPQADGARFRERMGLEDRPYLVYVGRLDPHKGSTELFDYFRVYKERNPGPLALVAVGEPVVVPPEHPDVFLTGFVDDQTRRDAVDGALALVQPSYFESFSLVLVEAWAQRKPALVQGRSDVLVGQSRRSGGGLPYVGYAEFEAAVDVLSSDGDLRARMAAAGRRYVERHYRWENVLDRYELLLDRVVLAA